MKKTKYRGRNAKKEEKDQDHYELPACRICHAVPFTMMIRTVDVSADADPPKAVYSLYTMRKSLQKRCAYENVQ
jgi:hypothetical protein